MMRETISMALASLLIFSVEVTAQPEGKNDTRSQSAVPLIAVLDSNRDGQIAFDELENAIAALKSLDVDNNGYLLTRELLGRSETSAPSGGGRRFGPRGPARFPVMAALDKNNDDEISADELPNVVAGLKTLDRDNNKSLSSQELLEVQSPQRGGPGGRGGFGRRFGPRGGGRGGQEQRASTEPLSFNDGALEIPDRQTFTKLSLKNPDAFRMDTDLQNQEVVKFVAVNVGMPDAKIYFQNTKNHWAHGSFINAVGLGRGGRGTMRGQIIHRPLQQAANGATGVYTYLYQPEDEFSFEMIKASHEMIEKAAPVTRGRLRYTPRGPSLNLYEEEKQRFSAAGIDIFLLSDVFKGIKFLPLNTAEGYGRLRLMKPAERPGPRDIVLFPTLPNELSRVAGIITSVRQTPLSHVNLRAVQDRVPNAFVENVHQKPEVVALIGKYVFLSVQATGYELRAASNQEVERHFEKLRPKRSQTPPRDLSIREIRPLDDIAFADSKAFGVKTANLAELRRLELPGAPVPNGFGVPFAFYEAYMKHNSFDETVITMQSKQRFRDDSQERREALKELRRRIRSGAMPNWIAEALSTMKSSFPDDQPLRCRSSTNNEDLPGFSGAGLYDSYTHRPDEGHIEKTIKEVFASLWNFRAYEEREFYRIDHTAAAMGVLIHPNYDDERSNGVAVTDDILYRSGRKYYVNTQVGEDLVTNPDAESIPEEILMDPRDSSQDQVVRYSNRVDGDEMILSVEQRNELIKCLTQIDERFRSLYGRSARAKFAIEIEFKITADGDLAIKQARPWVY